MIATKVYAVCIGVALVLATPASAVSLTNRDDRPYKVAITEGEARTEQALAPGGVLDGVCLAGCVLRLDNSSNDEYELEGPEIVSIEDGYLFYDGPDGPAEAPTGEMARPDAPKR